MALSFVAVAFDDPTAQGLVAAQREKLLAAYDVRVTDERRICFERSVEGMRPDFPPARTPRNTIYFPLSTT